MLKPSGASSGTKIGLPLAVAGGSIVVLCILALCISSVLAIISPPTPTVELKGLNTLPVESALAPPVQFANATATEFSTPTAPFPTMAEFPTASPLLQIVMSPIPTYASFATATVPYVAPAPPTSGSSGHPAGTSGQCKDGTYTSAAHRQGACSHHDGIALWWGP